MITECDGSTFPTHAVQEDGEGRKGKGGGYDVLSSSWSMLREKDGAVIGYQQKTLRGGK
jgi:hypothetical protein